MSKVNYYLVCKEHSLFYKHIKSHVNISMGDRVSNINISVDDGLILVGSARVIERDIDAKTGMVTLTFSLEDRGVVLKDKDNPTLAHSELLKLFI